MKSYIQKGDNITVSAAAAAASGEGVLVNKLFGIAAGDAAIATHRRGRRQRRRADSRRARVEP